MKFRDLLDISIGNLWRMKLRAFLTIAGVVIAIGAFVAMLSFGAGNRRIITDQVHELGLLFTMQIYPGEEADSAAAVLDRAAVERIAKLPGVQLAFPFKSFPVTVTLGDRVVESAAQALPAAAAGSKLYARVEAGEMFDRDASDEVVVRGDLLAELGVVDPDSLIGLPLVVSARFASVDSGLARILRSEQGDPAKLFRRVHMDSLTRRDYVARTIEKELGAAMQTFLGGLLEGSAVSDTLIVRGVVARSRGGPRQLGGEAVLIPEETARRFSASGVPADPLSLFDALQSGRLLGRGGGNSEEFPGVTLILEPTASHSAMRDTLAAMGFASHSFAEQFADMRRVFFFLDLALAAVGLIALLTAALGIANTMIMSIGERRREIGILKSLGADERDIRVLFLVESGVIGAIGSIFGILLGWIVARIASQVVQAMMAKQGIDPLDPFATPLPLIAVAFLFGIVVSVLAGAYPAARAAGVDPVRALRQE